MATSSNVPPGSGQSGSFTKPDYVADDIYDTFLAQTPQDNLFGLDEVIFGTQKDIADKVFQITGKRYNQNDIAGGLQALYRFGKDWYAATISHVGPGSGTHEIRSAQGHLTVLKGNLYMLLGQNQPVTDEKNERLFKGTMGWISYITTMLDRLITAFVLWKSVLSPQRLRTRKGQAQEALYDELIILLGRMRSDLNAMEVRIQAEFPGLYGPVGNGNGAGNGSTP